MSNARMHLRFRHRFPLIGHFLHWTLSRHGVSLNAHLGPFSRSWGTQAKTTTIDVPGHLGFFWRKQARRGSGTRRPRLSSEEQQALAAAHAGNAWTHVVVGLAFLEAAVEAIHIWVHPFSQAAVSGNPLFTLVVLTGGLIVVITFLHRQRIVGGVVLFILGVFGLWLQWTLFHSLAWHDVHAPVHAAAALTQIPL
jgi:hypothetical protein